MLGTSSSLTVITPRRSSSMRTPSAVTRSAVLRPSGSPRESNSKKRRPGSLSPRGGPQSPLGSVAPARLHLAIAIRHGSAKFPCLKQIGDQLSSKEDVAPGRLPHSLQGDALDDPVECLLEHFVELGSRQRLEFEPRNSAVSSESPQRIGDCQSTAKCQKYGRQTRDGDVVDEPCREPIEQVHVVDRQDDRPSSGPVLQILAEDGQQVHLVNLVQVAGKKLSQRTEGKWAQRFRRGDPFDVMVSRPAQNLVNQSRFSTPACPATRTPERSGSAMASDMNCCSWALPTIGHRSMDTSLADLIAEFSTWY